MPINWAVFVICVVTLLVVFTMFLIYKSNRSKIENRAILSLNELHFECCKSAVIDKDVFLEGWKFLADVYRIDPRKLRPSDSFVKLRSLKPLVFWDIEEDIEEYIIKRRGG
ncbi:MAG: hypothetical protein Q9M21_04905 [Mariprofundaceae bacterium]|nr:hypothetical protein [Mariprofundaceae bacterium]